MIDDLATFRRDFVVWLNERAEHLGPGYSGHGTLDAQIEQFRRLKRALFEADWGRYGWPATVGGLGGSPMMRAVVGEEITALNLCEPGPWSMIEVLAPTVMAFARPELVGELVPRFIRGEEMWCQGFSEPGTGSDLASLSCRATPTDGGWIVTGQKVWTSFIQYSARCVLLTRTGEPGSAHRGITAFLVDVDTPGISYRPIEIQNGRHEFAEVFYDDVFIPTEHLLGGVGQGWQVAMDVLPYERSTSFWHRGAFLQQRLGELVEAVAATGAADSSTARTLGEAYQSVISFRLRSRATQHRLAAGETPGVETSIDKILTASAEQTLFDAVRDLLPGTIEFDDTPEAEIWRSEYLYSRAATIYGGTAEIQRNIVARRLLDLGAEP